MNDKLDEWYRHPDGSICVPHFVGGKVEHWPDGRNEPCKRDHTNKSRMVSRADSVEELPMDGVLGVRQVDENTVEVKYAGPTRIITGTAESVLEKLREAKGLKGFRR